MLNWSQESIEDNYSNKSINENNIANPIEEETNFKTEGFLNDKDNDVFRKENQFDISSFPQSENENINYDNLYFNQNKNLDENIKHENSNQIKDKNVDEEKSSQNAGLNSAKKNEENYNIKSDKIDKVKKAKRGRKSKKSKLKGKHNKNSPGNIINKIKTHFFNHYIRDLIKKNSIYKKILLSKFQTKKFTANLNKQKNFELFKKKIKDILCENEISTKYSTLDEYENKKIIDKMYEENKEIKIIKILELTYEELFIIYRRKLKNPEDEKTIEKIKGKIEGLDLLEDNNKYNDFESLIKKLKDEKHEEEYIEHVKDICLVYKNYFQKNIKDN